MLRFLRFPLGTPLYVRPERIAAVSVYRTDEPDAAVIHIENDARETVWGDVDSVDRVLIMCENRPLYAAQVVLNGVVERAQHDYQKRNKRALSPITGPEEHAG